MIKNRMNISRYNNFSQNISKYGVMFFNIDGHWLLIALNNFLIIFTINFVRDLKTIFIQLLVHCVLKNMHIGKYYYVLNFLKPLASWKKNSVVLSSLFILNYIMYYYII